MPIGKDQPRMWGRFEHSLDEKGRVIVPLKFRETLGEEFAISTGSDNHIRIYPMAVWKHLEEPLLSTDFYDEQDPELVFLQRMFGNSEIVSYDQQHRLQIPLYMREWAKLREKDPCIVVGNGSRVEIWNRTLWEQYSANFTAKKAADASLVRKASTRPPAATVVAGGDQVEPVPGDDIDNADP